MRARINRLEAELTNLRDRQALQEARALDEELQRDALVRIYGDIGFRYHQLFESQRETFNRPEFRLHLGVFGTAFDQDADLIRYDVRLATAALDINDMPVPTISWLPLPGFSAQPQFALDRYLFEYQRDRTLGITVGRFPSPFAGTEMMFDFDYHFQGLSQRVRFDRLFGEAFRRVVPRLELIAVQGYMAQNRIGLPDQPVTANPAYLGGQLRFHLAPFERIERTADGQIVPDINSPFEFRLALGLHWYDGADEIKENVGVGHLERTTNVLAEDGDLVSRFMIGETHLEFVAWRTRRAQLRAWAHGVINLHADGHPDYVNSNGKGVDFGLSGGMHRLEERWDFNISGRYFYIEADAVVPEFNSETLNTNIKGYEIELSVRIFPTVTAFGIFTLSERKDYELYGFGLPSRWNPERASGQSMRLRFGLFLEF